MCRRHKKPRYYISRNVIFRCQHQKGQWHRWNKCIPWWRHQMETFSALLALCAGNSPVTGGFPAQRPVTSMRGIHRLPMDSPHKGQWRRALMFSLICAWIDGWGNNREAGDLRHNRPHYDVTVICNICISILHAIRDFGRLINYRWFGNNFGLPSELGWFYHTHC